MRFRDLLGNTDLKNRLVKSVIHGRVPHAQLFVGAEGSAALPLALAYTSYLLCEQSNGNDACGHCNACKKTTKFIHPDVHFLYPIVGTDSSVDKHATQWREMLLANPYLNAGDWAQEIAEENKLLNITAQECRKVQTKLSYKAVEGKYKVLIIWRPEYLGNEGNILLKILEEPPTDTIFILVAENTEAVISTIQSRTQLIKISHFPDQDIAKYLIENDGANEELAKNIAFLAEGNMNKALKLHSQLANEELNTLHTVEFLRWMRLCYNPSKGMKDLLQWVDQTSRLGREMQKTFLALCATLMRECVLLNMNLEKLVRLPAQDIQSLQAFKPFINVANIQALSELLSKAQYYVERNANPRLLFLNLSFKITPLLRNKQ